MATKKNGAPKVDKARTYSAKAEDVVPLTQLAFFSIQLGYNTVALLIDQWKSIGAHTTPATLTKTLLMMKANGLLTSDVRVQDDGNPAEEFKVKADKVSFTGLSMDHILILEQQLAKSEAGIKLSQVVGNQKGREIKDYYRLFCLMRNVEPFFGAYPIKPGNKGMQKWYANSPYKCEGLKVNVEPYPLMFWREEQGGALKIHRAIVRNWIAELMQTSNKASSQDYMREYIMAKHIYIGPQQELTSVTLPVLGVGMTTYEALPAGEIFQVIVDVPTSKIPIPQWIEMLVDHQWVSKNSLSPGRGAQTGDIDVLTVDSQPKDLVDGERPVRREYTAPQRILDNEMSDYMKGVPINPYESAKQEEPDGLYWPEIMTNKPSGGGYKNDQHIRPNA